MPQDSAARRHREILDAIAELGRRLDRLAPAPASSPRTDLPAAAAGTGGGGIPDELRTLAKAIAETRKEVAALRRRTPAGEALAASGDGLDVVVQATEAATEVVLAASEEIDDLVGRMRQRTHDATDVALLEAIAERVIRIFEACSFQDITSQRIGKVIATVSLIEDRLSRMLDRLGAAETPAVADPPPEAG